MTPDQLSKSLRKLRKICKNWHQPTAVRIAESYSPFCILVCCILSLRTRDEVTEQASLRLFEIAVTPDALLKMTTPRLERLIYPVAFFRNKANSLKQMSREIIERHQGRVPASLDDLLELKGVGRKTANLTLVLGFKKPGICVDVHVHRIFNRWAYVSTKTPDETEIKLREKLPRRYWKEINEMLVTFGQNQCKPTSPHCSTCCLEKECPQVGVGRKR